MAREFGKFIEKHRIASLRFAIVLRLFVSSRRLLVALQQVQKVAQDFFRTMTKSVV